MVWECGVVGVAIEVDYCRRWGHAYTAGDMHNIFTVTMYTIYTIYRVDRVLDLDWDIPEETR